MENSKIKENEKSFVKNCIYVSLLFIALCAVSALMSSCDSSFNFNKEYANVEGSTLVEVQADSITAQLTFDSELSISLGYVSGVQGQVAGQYSVIKDKVYINTQLGTIELLYIGNDTYLTTIDGVTHTLLKEKKILAQKWAIK